MGTPTTITRTGYANADPAELLRLVASTDGFTSINPHLTADPKLRITPFGPDAGVGSGFAFRGKDGAGTQTLTAVDEAHVDYLVDMGILGRSTQRITVTPSSHGGSDLTWIAQIAPGLNPLQRIFSLFAERVLGPTLQTGIDNLAASTPR